MFANNNALSDFDENAKYESNTNKGHLLIKEVYNKLSPVDVECKKYEYRQLGSIKKRYKKTQSYNNESNWINV